MGQLELFYHFLLIKLSANEWIRLNKIMLNRNASNNISVNKKMSFDSFKNDTYKLFASKSYTFNIYKCKKELVLNILSFFLSFFLSFLSSEIKVLFENENNHLSQVQRSIPNLWRSHTCSLPSKCGPVGCRIHRLHLCRGVRLHQRVFWILLYFDLRPGPKILFQGDRPEGIDTFQWPVIERDCVGGLRLMIWDKVKVPLCHYSDAPEESNLWTAWQLFPLDDD